MNRDQQTYELIEQYLQGELTGEAMADFEQQLQTDEELREEVQVQREVHEMLGDTELTALDEKLSAIRSEFEEEGIETGQADEAPVVKLNPYRRLWLVAAAVLTLAIVYLGFFRDQELTGTELFTSYYEAYPADVISRASPEEVTVVEKAILLYAEGNYSEASFLLGVILDPDTRVHFYHGMCLLNLGEDEPALEKLTAAAIDDNSVYQVPAKWYASLLLLRLDKRDEAKELLTVISQSASGKYQNLADQLLGDL